MLIKSDQLAAAVVSNSAAAPAPTKCVNCGAEERRLLHHVRHRGIFLRLCTNCVLRLHPLSFCPTCFQVYPPTPSSNAILPCFKCHSSSHSHCVTAPRPYICPLCANPNTPIFQLKPLKEADVNISNSKEFKMDRDSANKLLAAAKIATQSMNQAAMAARAEAERRAKEATCARKRAKEALERVVYLMMKQKSRKKENNVNAVNNGHRNGVVSSGAGPFVILEEKINMMENSNQVMAALKAVELRENEKMSEPTAENVEFGVNMDYDFFKMMDMDDNGGMWANDVVNGDIMFDVESLFGESQ